MKCNINQWQQFRGAGAALLFTLSVFTLLSCSKSESEKSVVRVAVAANVQFAFEELKAAYEKSHNVRIEHSLGSSGKLTAQIQNGAPYHIFLAANMKYPRALLESGNAVGDIGVYAKGGVVFWTLHEEIDPVKWQSEIAAENRGKIAVANPRNAPYGEAAIACLKQQGLYEKVESRLVMGESISQTNQFIVSRSADMGFTAKSVVLSPSMKDRGRWSDLPEGCYRPIEQGAVLLSEARGEIREPVLSFYNFLFSQEAKEIFQKFGYTTEP